ncbi:saccharopine dehydrogenase family protein [Actinospica sp.]|jgi:saccharopine dehydrogenase-like NADP-dependent oxidoreductase|uniref:saccharopine dehydrogenase family protein n=1 Tax=Actinospica sp. TaxID=1872142 RepID=UPI0032C2161E
METVQKVAVFGAYGHTGRFVVRELLDRGFVPVAIGRDSGKLRALAERHPGLEVREATVEDPASLDRAFGGTAAVINCAGPFAATVAPVVEAALRTGIPYVDVAAEIEATVDTFAQFGDRALAAGIAVVPAMAFFGGLGDLLATAALGDWSSADEVHIAYGLSSWHPTSGTRVSGKVSRERSGGRSRSYTNGRLQYHDGERPTLGWKFPEPLGPRPVVGEFTMTDAVTIPTHVSVPEILSYMTVEAVADVANPDTAAPVAADESGRSDQTFLVDVIVCSGGEERRAGASGRDIYAISAPLAVEAVDRILSGKIKGFGVASAGGMFDAEEFLTSLSARNHIARV